ncbi:TPA: DUF2000 domain-containing protein [Legionella pneumophila]|uniref:Uncharacterized protein conserved in bacteria n=2 Tax=Legionella TaxID=445 RepID=A0A378PHN0_9GAMM|nr:MULTISPECIES: DUF2000 domain-containing protein [Legionella]MCA0402507.1 DUF2000 domain-containing protein [Pseudomonadota bacterium]KTD70735.1 hypothetical protein Lstg_3220 [Legionella steigerwaltii]MCL9684136.1 DUF2000 domain-containing protein [Legionella maioricensis]MCL9686957.1 DUF2000 domain-containing protein [Legionella maioricensis]OJW10525.1 MAG: hypothetical protein BGO44_01520 [Legionella sp. 39-23]
MVEHPFKNKLVAVLNKRIEPGKVMNALAHMCIGLGSVIGEEELRLTDYRDADGGSHPYISEIPFIILCENSNKIRTLRQNALAKNVFFNDFTDTMTVGTYQEQIERTAEVKENDLIYYGIVLFGDWDVVTELTRKCSLWR